MKICDLDKMTAGWFIGNFNPAAYQTSDFEVAIKEHPKGEQWDIHYHKIGTEVNDTIIKKILNANIHVLEISVTNSINKGPYLLLTLLNDKNNSKDEAITEIYKMLRPGEPPTIEIANDVTNAANWKPPC